MNPQAPPPFRARLDEAAELIGRGLDGVSVRRLLRLCEAPMPSDEVLDHLRLYSETLPKGREPGFTPEQRYLHAVWDLFDRGPASISVNFSIPFRRLLAARLFARCGAAFVCEEQVRFNFGQFITAGQNVFFNRGVYLDSKGGITLGDDVALAEDVRIFTHGHSEASHMERTYQPVTIGSRAKVYAGATILPGVTIGEEAIVGSGSIVSHDVPAGMVAVGVPAKVVRERRTEGRHGDDLDHLWLF